MKQRVLTVNDLSLLAEPFRIIDFNTTNGVNYILLALVFCYEFEPDLPTPNPAGLPAAMAATAAVAPLATAINLNNRTARRTSAATTVLTAGTNTTGVTPR